MEKQVVLRWNPPEYFTIGCTKCKEVTFISMISGNVQDIKDIQEVFCPFCGTKLKMSEANEEVPEDKPDKK